jgi:hypothetical protein
MKCDKWRMTHDIWHLHITQKGWWKLSQSFRSLALRVWDLWYFEDLEDDLMKWSGNHKGACRTALARMGLLSNYNWVCRADPVKASWCVKYVATNNRRKTVVWCPSVNRWIYLNITGCLMILYLALSFSKKYLQGKTSWVDIFITVSS